MSFSDEVLDEQQAGLRRERDRLKSELTQAHQRNSELSRLLNLLESAGTATPPKWLQPKRPKGKHSATICGILSDCHFDEVVRPEEIGGRNAYNREIATIRLERWAQAFVAQARDYLAGLEWDGAVVCLGGDIFSGNLHDLAETNEDTLFGSLLYWSEQIIAALTVIVDAFGRLHVPCVVGNHGRMTHKPRTKLRARDNLDWLLAQMVAKHFAGDDRVSVFVNDNPDVFFTCYNTTFLLTHGDQVTGGGGIGGIWPPIMRMVARKAVRYNDTPFDVVVMGHFHQLIMAPTQGLVVNGSLKGYDEFAALHNFRPEPPQQAIWVTTPERGVTWSGPIFAGHRESEGW